MFSLSQMCELRLDLTQAITVKGEQEETDEGCGALRQKWRD